MKRLSRHLLLSSAVWVLGLSVLGCGPVLHEELLTESIKSFSGKMKSSATEKIWIAGPNDSACDAGCCAGKGGGKASALGGLFGGGSGGSYDKLAYEIFANFLTQRKKAAVVETHRHNYATELATDTHRKLEVSENGNKISSTSCEDLCLLDEAKKRKANKVLAYHIIDMKGDELTIHFRLSDVPTGVVELAQTLRVYSNLHAIDVSFGYSGAIGPVRNKHAEPANND